MLDAFSGTRLLSGRCNIMLQALLCGFLLLQTCLMACRTCSLVLVTDEVMSDVLVFCFAEEGYELQGRSRYANLTGVLHPLHSMHGHRIHAYIHSALNKSDTGTEFSVPLIFPPNVAPDIGCSVHLHVTCLLLISRKQDAYRRAIATAFCVQAYRHAHGLQRSRSVGAGAVSLPASSKSLCRWLAVQHTKDIAKGSNSIRRARDVA